VNLFPQKCNCVWWCRKEEEEESFMLSTKRTFPFFLGMHILFVTLPTFLLHFLWLYIIYDYFYSSLISPLISLQICSFHFKFVLSYFRALFLPHFFILPRCVFVSIICEYTSKYNALENLKHMVMFIYYMKNLKQ